MLKKVHVRMIQRNCSYPWLRLPEDHEDSAISGPTKAASRFLSSERTQSILDLDQRSFDDGVEDGEASGVTPARV